MKSAFFIFLLSICFNASSAIIYVNASATGANNGSSWANAFTDLQSALSVAFINDDIWVASGTYHPTSTTNRDVSFVMKNGVDIYGSFAGNETAISQRNISLNPTTLSGDIGQLGDNTDNSKKIVKVQNFTANFVMDGFRVLSGYDGTSTGKGSGMYMFNNSGSQITINNCIFYNNYSYHSGGALIVDDTHVTFNNCEFLYNSSFNYGGGAIYSANVSNSDIYLYDSKLIGNNSRDGAAINFDGLTLILERCLVSNNTTTSGDIISVSNGVDTFLVNNSLLVGNLIDDAGGSLISIYSSSPAMTISNSTICHNKNGDSQTPYYEMIHRSNGSLNIYNSIIFGNTNSDQNLQIDPGNYVANSIVENGYSPGVNVITTAPNFAAPGSLAIAPFDASTYDYSLVLNSPGINSGNNVYATQFTFDYALNPRIQQINVDCGAIESPFSDTQAPTAICQNHTINLNNLGSADITTSSINNGSYDNIGITNYTLSNSNFDCSNVGSNTVTLTVYDAAGNSDMCLSTITVIDATAPTVVGQNISIDLDASGNALIDASQIENGSTDNCGIQSYSISQTSFSCSDIGNNSITLSVEDVNGNIGTGIYTVTVNDVTPPIAIAQDITVYLNSSGNAAILNSSVNNGSNDECSIASFNVSPNSVNCTNVGSVSGTFTVTDAGGNSSTDSFTITVLDTIAPTTIGMNIQVNLATSNPYIITPSDLNNGSYDNCSFNLSIDQNSFNTVGVYDVNLTSTDGSGNFSTETYQVDVIESFAGLLEYDTDDFRIFPNPFHSSVHVKLRPSKNYTLVLLSSDGKELKTWFDTTNEMGDIIIHMNEISNGVYYLKIIDSIDSSRIRKLIKTDKLN